MITTFFFWTFSYIESWVNKYFLIFFYKKLNSTSSLSPRLGGIGFSANMIFWRFFSCTNIKMTISKAGYFWWDFPLKFLSLFYDTKNVLLGFSFVFWMIHHKRISFSLKLCYYVFSCVSSSGLITDWTRWGFAVWRRGIWSPFFCRDFSSTDSDFLSSYLRPLSEYLLSFMWYIFYWRCGGHNLWNLLILSDSEFLPLHVRILKVDGRWRN